MAKITLDSSEYEKGLSNASQSTSSMSSKMSTALKGIGTVIAGVTTTAVALGTTIVKLASDTAEYGDEIDKESQKLQVSAENYQALQFAAEHCGFEMSSFNTAVRTLQGTDFDGNIIDAIDSVMALGTAEERTAKASELFGDRATQQLQPLIQGEMTMADYTAQLEELGGMMSNDSVSASAKFEDSLTNLKTAFTGLKNNLMGSFMPSITTIMDGLSALISGKDGSIDTLNDGIMSFIENLSSTFTTVVDTIVALLPTLISGLGEIVNGIIEILPELVTSVVDVLTTTLLPTLLEMLPDLLSSGTEMLVAIYDGFASAIPSMIEMLPQLLSTIQTFITENLDLIIQSGIELLVAIITGLSDALPVLAQYIPEILLTVIDVITRNLPMIIQSGITVIVALINGLVKALPQLVKYAPQIIKGIATALKTALSSIKDVGKNLISGLWNGINDKIQWIKDKISGFGTTILNSIKGIFGIASPSKKTKQFGKYLAEGLGIGFEDEMETVNNDIANALPTFDDIPTATFTSGTATGTSGYYDMVDAFKMALAEMSVTMDGKQMGKFINKTVTKAVYDGI